MLTEIHRQWHSVKLTNATFRNHFTKKMPSQCMPIIREWCNSANSAAQYCSFGGRFYFENEGDATYFALRWL